MSSATVAFISMHCFSNVLHFLVTSVSWLKNTSFTHYHHLKVNISNVKVKKITALLTLLSVCSSLSVTSLCCTSFSFNASLRLSISSSFSDVWASVCSFSIRDDSRHSCVLLSLINRIKKMNKRLHFSSSIWIQQ